LKSKAASVVEGRKASNSCRMFYGFAAGAGAGLACTEPSTSKPQSPSLCSLPLFKAASTSRAAVSKIGVRFILGDPFF
jgi:hypothetical protein